MTTTPPYLDDIRSQPTVLAELLDAGLGDEAKTLVSRLERFDRIVMTGMGASLFAHTPAFLRLVAAGWPVWMIETSELLGAAGGLLTPRSLLWITSQSGESAEVTALLDRLEKRGPTVLGVTNDTGSDLALRADVVLALHSGEEQTVGTRSYVNTLAAQALATSIALREQVDDGLFVLPEQLENYLAGWDGHLEELAAAVSTRTLFVVGRGASLAAALTGSLVIKEAAKIAAEGMSTPQFRHGPLELVGPDVTVLLLAGEGPMSEPNLQMQSDIRRAGGRNVWLGPNADQTGITLPHTTTPHALPIAEILPLQLLSVVLAERNGVEPGAFRHIQKITRTL